MVVIILHKPGARLRGVLSRWMIEPHPGVFIGTPTARVRDRVWHHIQAHHPLDGGALLIYRTPGEPGYNILIAGDPRREIVDFDGLPLVKIRPQDPTDPAAP